MAEDLIAMGHRRVRKVFVPSQCPVPVAVPPLLSFVAGFIDSYTVLALFGLFVAQVTGSFVLAAVAFVASEQGVVIKVLAIPVFLLAAAVATIIAILAERRRLSALAFTLGFEGLVLAGFFALLLVEAPLRNPNSPIVIAASLAGLFAMGTQSAIVRLLMRNMASTNVMTTNTTQIAIDAAEMALAWHGRRSAPDDAEAAAAFAGARARVAGLFPIMFAFLLGTAGGTIAHVFAGPLGLLLPLAIVGALFAWAAFGCARN